MPDPRSLAPNPWPGSCGKDTRYLGRVGADHPSPWVWCTFRAVGVTGSWDSGVRGPALTSIPCPRRSFSTWLHSSLSFTEDWRGRPYISQTDPPHPSMLVGWLREGWPHT